MTYRSLLRTALPILLILLSGMTVLSTPNATPVYGIITPVFTGWAGECTSGTNCDTTGNADHSVSFNCTAATCTGLTSGSGDGQFDGPYGVAVDGSGNVYVVDPGNNRVEKFVRGVFVGWTGGCTGGPNCVGGTHSNGFTCTAATCTGPIAGSGDGQFRWPWSVAVDSSGNVYITDFQNERVVKFVGGVFSGWAGGCVGGTNCGHIGTGGPDTSIGFDCTAATCKADTNPGQYGDGQFYDPSGVAVDSSGNVYVSDFENNRVELFKPPRLIIDHSTPNQFFSGWLGLCTGGSNCDTTGGVDHSVGFTCTFLTCGQSASGSGPGQFDHQWGVTVDGSGNVYVVDESNSRVEEFSSTGAYVTAWGCANAGNGCGPPNASNTGDGQFIGPTYAAVDGFGNVYVTDQGNERVEEFSPSGASFLGWAGECTGGINCDTAGGADHSFGFTCTAATCTGLTSGSGDGQFNLPYGVAVGENWNAAYSTYSLFVAEVNNHRVDEYVVSE